jgi:hypothetical protein
MYLMSRNRRKGYRKRSIHQNFPPNMYNTHSDFLNIQSDKNPVYSPYHNTHNNNKCLLNIDKQMGLDIDLFLRPKPNPQSSI